MCRTLCVRACGCPRVCTNCQNVHVRDRVCVGGGVRAWVLKVLVMISTGRVGDGEGRGEV